MDAHLGSNHLLEARSFGVAAAGYVFLVTLAILLSSPGGLWPNTLSVILLATALAARYVLWVRQWQRQDYYSFRIERLDWLLIGGGVTTGAALVLLLGAPAQAYFYLIATEGALALLLTGRRVGVVLWLMAAVAAASLCVLLVAGWAAAWQTLLFALPGYLLVVVMVGLLAGQMLERLQVETLLLNLERAHSQVRIYTARIEDLTVVQERARLAHELHDSLGHTLTALDVQVELLARLPLSEEAARLAANDQARRLVKQALTEVRSSVAALRPAVLQKVDAHTTIADLVHDFARVTGLPIAWTLAGAPQPLTPAATLLLYRAAQEALTNVQRHAPTTPDVQVRLTFDVHTVTLYVENRTPLAPIAPSPHSGGVGLAGLHDRAVALGGAFTAAPLPAGGFRLELRLPLG